MFDPVSQIEVFVRPFGSSTPYKEYEATKSTTVYTGKHLERFVEAIADERYEIVVVLREPASLPGRDYIYTGCDMDKGAMASQQYKKLTSAAGKSQEIKFIHSSKTVKTHGQWKDIGFSFGQMTIDPSLELSEREQTAMNDRGKIVVAIRLGSVNVNLPAGDTCPEYVDKSPDRTSEKMAVDRGKSHCFKPVYLGASKPVEPFFFRPNDPRYRFSFTFHFTSRGFLLSQGFDLDGTSPGPIKQLSLPPKGSTLSSKQGLPISSRKHDYDDEIEVEHPPQKQLKIEERNIENRPRTSLSSHIEEQSPSGSGQRQSEQPTTQPSRNPLAEHGPRLSRAELDLAQANFLLSPPIHHSRDTALDGSSSANTPSARSPSTGSRSSKDRRRRMIELELQKLAFQRELLELEDGDD